MTPGMTSSFESLIPICLVAPQTNLFMEVSPGDAVTTVIVGFFLLGTFAVAESVKINTAEGNAVGCE